MSSLERPGESRLGDVLRLAGVAEDECQSAGETRIRREELGLEVGHERGDAGHVHRVSV